MPSMLGIETVFSLLLIAVLGKQNHCRCYQRLATIVRPLMSACTSQRARGSNELCEGVNVIHKSLAYAHISRKLHCASFP